MSQTNLLSNPGFENGQLPTGLAQLSSHCTDWFSGQGSPDLFDKNANNIVDIPLNNFGFQELLINGGNRYAGFLSHLNVSAISQTGNVSAEHIAQEITIEKNKIYEISYYISLAENFDIPVQNIGIFFSDNQLPSNFNYYLANPHWQQNTLITDNTDDWQYVKGYFLAEADYNYLYLGYFGNIDNGLSIYETMVEELGHHFIPGTQNIYRNYYYIDNFKIIEIDEMCDCNGLYNDVNDIKLSYTIDCVTEDDEFCFNFYLPTQSIGETQSLNFNCNISGYEVWINGVLEFEKSQDRALYIDDKEIGKLCFNSSDFAGPLENELNLEVKYFDITGRVICTINQTILKPDFCKYDLRYEIIENTFEPCCKKIKFPYLCNDITSLNIDEITYNLAPDLEWSDKVIELCDLDLDPQKKIYPKDNNGKFLCLAEIDLGSCQQPCDECVDEIQGWLEVTTDETSATCDEDECLVTLDFEIPDEFACYTHVSFETTLNGTPLDINTGLEDATLFDLSTYMACIPKGLPLEITIKLYKGENDTEPCEIIQTAFCGEFDESPPCTPDCPEDAWEKQDDLHIPMVACPGCFMRISYYTRKANCITEKHDIQITAIDKYGTNCSSTACDDGVTYREAVFAIIAENEMDFNIPVEDGDDCFTTLRVSKSSCWTYSNVIDYYSPSGELISTLLSLRPCNSDCCLRELTVCFENGELIVTAGENVTPNQSCTNASHSYPPEFVNCFYTCDYLDNVNVSLKNTYFNEDDTNEYVKLQESISGPNNLFIDINVKSNNEFLDINISKTNGKSMKFNIFDMTGNQLIESSEQLIPNNNHFNVSLSDLNSGSYVYNIEVDGILVKTDNIIIVK